VRKPGRAHCGEIVEDDRLPGLLALHAFFAAISKMERTRFLHPIKEHDGVD
jgi:hypothetical protein